LPPSPVKSLCAREDAHRGRRYENDRVDHRFDRPGKTAALGRCMDLVDRTVVVTGGARGLGLAAAQLFLQRGARIVIGALHAESLASAVSTLDGGDRVAAVASDIATVAGCRAVAQAALEAFGTIDVLFTNAGVYATAEVEEMSEETWGAIIDSNLKGTFFCVQAALPALRRARGVVIAMASDAELVGVRGGCSAYGAAKAGIVNLTKQLALDLAPDVRVNCIAPGFIATEKLLARADADAVIKSLSQITPLQRLGTPAEVADAAVYAAESDFMTGATISLDGGITSGY
jgi:NAD(P)-dependent dehydrogenase (short-subunit alcohol dehydrogenase family)